MKWPTCITSILLNSTLSRSLREIPPARSSRMQLISTKSFILCLHTLVFHWNSLAHSSVGNSEHHGKCNENVQFYREISLWIWIFALKHLRFLQIKFFGKVETVRKTKKTLYNNGSWIDVRRVCKLFLIQYIFLHIHL